MATSRALIHVCRIRLQCMQQPQTFDMDEFLPELGTIRCEFVSNLQQASADRKKAWSAMTAELTAKFEARRADCLRWRRDNPTPA